MYVLITYDVNTTTPEGRKKLRNVAKCCQKYGQRVQNSVFECMVDGSSFVKLRGELLHIIDQDEDSIRIYHLGKQFRSKIEEYGKKTSFAIEGELII